jgi:hypothetical protein
VAISERFVIILVKCAKWHEVLLILFAHKRKLRLIARLRSHGLYLEVGRAQLTVVAVAEISGLSHFLGVVEVTYCLDWV